MVHFFFPQQLQEAFAKGLLKPGLNEEIERVEKKCANSVTDLKIKLKEFQLKLPWVETLDLVTVVAPMAPDVALQMQETAQRRKYVLMIIFSTVLNIPDMLVFYKTEFVEKALSQNSTITH